MTTYELYQLSEVAQKKAYGDWLEHFQYPYNEAEKVIETIASIHGITISDWWFSAKDFSFDMSVNDRRIAELRGAELTEYLSHQLKTVRESEEYQVISRAYEYFGESIREYLNRPESFQLTYQQIMKWCVKDLFFLFEGDYAHSTHFEEFENECEINKWRFLEDGTKV